MILNQHNSSFNFFPLPLLIWVEYIKDIVKLNKFYVKSIEVKMSKLFRVDFVENVNIIKRKYYKRIE